MYTMFIQKVAGELPKFYLTRIMIDFANKTNANGIVLSPGYIYKGGATTITSSSRLYDLWDETLASSIQSIGFLNTMNPSIFSSYMTMLLSHKPTINQINFKLNGKSDHRKMIFVIKERNLTAFQIDSTNVNNYLDNIEILGVFIGSSNYSCDAHLGNTFTKVAEKGESDILMFYDDNYANEFLELDDVTMRTRVILSKSMRPVKDDYLKEIYRNVLLSSII